MLATSRWVPAVGFLLGGAVLALVARNHFAESETRDLWSALSAPSSGGAFDPASVAELPEPARRFLTRAIAPGTPLARSVELRMRGTILLDPERAPMAMTAEQILAPPNGFVWRARAGAGPVRISGFDRYGFGEGEMRWKAYGLVPVMHVTGPDVTRSAAGRLAMEAVLMPASLLPGTGVVWEPIDSTRARFLFTVGAERVETTLEVDSAGRPIRASAARWNTSRPDGTAGYDTFTVELSGEFARDGYTLPARVEAGWRLGDPDEFRFFTAELTDASFR